LRKCNIKILVFIVLFCGLGVIFVYAIEQSTVEIQLVLTDVKNYDLLVCVNSLGVVFFGEKNSSGSG